jgi:hypothetical protein
VYGLGGDHRWRVRLDVTPAPAAAATSGRWCNCGGLFSLLSSNRFGRFRWWLDCRRFCRTVGGYGRLAIAVVEEPHRAIRPDLIAPSRRPGTGRRGRRFSSGRFDDGL